MAMKGQSDFIGESDFQRNGLLLDVSGATNRWVAQRASGTDPGLNIRVLSGQDPRS